MRLICWRSSSDSVGTFSIPLSLLAWLPRLPTRPLVLAPLHELQGTRFRIHPVAAEELVDLGKPESWGHVQRLEGFLQIVPQGFRDPIQ